MLIIFKENLEEIFSKCEKFVFWPYLDKNNVPNILFLLVTFNT